MTHALEHRVDVDTLIDERERVRSLRVQRHLVVGSLATVALIVVVPMATSLWIVWLVPVLLAVALESISRAGNAYLGFLWGWPHAEPKKVAPLDRLVEWVIHFIKVRSQSPPPPEQKIRLLAPRS